MFCQDSARETCTRVRSEETARRRQVSAKRKRATSHCALGRGSAMRTNSRRKHSLFGTDCWSRTIFATRPVYAAKKNLMGTNGSDMTSDGIDKFHVTPVPAMSTHLDSMCISLDFLLSFLPLLLRLFVARDSAKCNSFCRGGNANADFTLGVTNFLIESMHQFCSLEESRSDRI